LTILIGFSAVNTANNLLYIITSALLSYMLVSGIFGRKNLRGIAVSLEFPEERFADSITPTGVKVTNERRFMPAFLIRILIDDEEVLFPIVGPRSTVVQYLNMVFQGRGLHTITDITVASVFPFNFFTRYRRIPKNLELMIFPKLQRCSLNHLFSDHTRWKGDVSSDAPGYDSDLISIRSYVSGDPVKYISWKATAKTGQLKTKELSSMASPNVMLDFHRLTGHDLEQTLSSVAYMIVKLIQSGTAVGLMIGDEIYKPDHSASHKVMLLTRLALYGQN
jgi:uncharacterized protein (DUF58 family)